MNIVLLGAPGAGKGTQGGLIVKEFNLPHISTGDIFRQNIKENTPLGKKAKKYIDEGKLVPDSVVIEIVASRLSEKDCKGGFMLDGFPRTVVQAQELDKIADINAVINLDMDEETLIYRISGRRICGACGKVSHVEWLTEGEKCGCGGDYTQRKDDDEDTVRKRLQVYAEQTKPLIEYYKKQGKLVVIDSSRDKAEVHKDVMAALKKFVK